jgi:SAM-dependent methyltransferase
MKEINLDNARDIDWEQVAKEYDPNADWEDLILIRSTADLVGRYGKGAARLIEVGTSTGVGTRALLQHFDKLDILDPARTNLDRIMATVPDAAKRITPHQAYVEDFEAHPPYDFAVLSFVLEHVEDPLRVIQALARLVKVGGKIAIAVPNYEALNRRLGLELGMVSRIDYFQEKDRLVGHRRLYSLRTLRDDVVASKAPLKEVAAHGLFMKPLSKSQMEIWKPSVIDALVKVGLDFPTLGCGIFLLLERVA